MEANAAMTSQTSVSVLFNGQDTGATSKLRVRLSDAATEPHVRSQSHPTQLIAHADMALWAPFVNTKIPVSLTTEALFVSMVSLYTGKFGSQSKTQFLSF